MRARLLAVASLVLIAGVFVAVFVIRHRHETPTLPKPSSVPFKPTRPRQAAKPPPGVAWPTYGYDNERLRAVAGIGLRPPFHRLWTFHGHALLEFPPVVGYGRVFIPNFSGRLFALDARTGRTVWKYTSGRCGWASPALAAHVVYETFIGSAECGSRVDDGELVAFSERTGRVLWLRRLGPCESSPLVAGGSVYVGDWNGTVYGFDARSGRLRWRFDAGGAIKGSLALASGRLYFGTYAGDVFALAARNGSLVWRSGGHGEFYSSPALAYGRVYIGSLNGEVYAFAAANGQLLWSRPTGGYVYASPAVWRRLVLLGSYDHDFYAFDAADGSLRWRYHANAPISGAASVVDRIVYFSSFDERTYALDVRDGRELTRWPDGKYSPVVSDRRRLYLVGLGRLYALAPALRLRS